MSLSFSKWKNILTGSHNADSMHNTNKKSKHATSANEKLEPEVGFKMILDPNGSSLKNSLNAADKNLTNVPELNVHIIGARHLPSLFGLKTVEGYIIKVSKICYLYNINIHYVIYTKKNDSILVFTLFLFVIIF